MNIQVFISRIERLSGGIKACNWQFSIVVILYLLVFLILFGCQNLGTKNNNNQVTHVTLWQGINPPVNRDVFNKLVKKFNQNNPGIQIESIFVGEPQIPKILTAVVGNAPPDIFLFDPQMTGKFVELGAIKSLNNWVENLPMKSEIYSNLWDELRLNDKIWSVPLYTSNIGIFYRPKLFSAAGIKETPETWEEFRQVAKKLTIDRNGDGQPEQYGIVLPLGKQEWTVFCWLPFLWSAGGEIMNNDNPNFDSPEAIAALQFWQDLLKSGYAKLSAPERGYDESDFISGRVAMQITGPWTNITKSDVDYDIFPIPASVRHATSTGTGSLYVMKTTPVREKAALKFLEYILSEEFQAEWSIKTGFIPTNQKVSNSKLYQEYVSKKPGLQVFLEQMTVARARPNMAGYSRLSDSLGRAIEAVLLGESPQKALQMAQEQLRLIWNKNSK